MESFELYCPVVTPFASNGDDVGRVDTDSLAALVAHLDERGVDGFVPAGTTGEFAALGDRELATVVETVVDAAPADSPVVAGASATSVPTARERMEVVADAGADAALLVAPYYDAAGDETGNHRFFAALLRDAPLPVYLYNIPPIVGQEIAVETIRTLAEEYDVAGVKDTSGDQRYFQALLRETPDDVDVYQGYDGGLVSATALGADGAVSVLSNVVPETLSAITTAVGDGDLARARELQIQRAGPVFDACVEHGFAATMKAVLSARDVITEPTVRPPLADLPGETRQELLDHVERVASLGEN